jgi:hypothetical protein
MSDKRSVSTDALETLGTIIGEGCGRDAIHLAVEPVVAACLLKPGSHVGLLADGRAGVVEKPLGIVDPFLGNYVQPGERFWLVVYPRQITSLRHVWSHPEFPENSVPAAAKYGYDEQWIRAFAEEVGISYTVLMDAAEAWVESKKHAENIWGGEYLCLGGLLEGKYVPEGFWTHYEAVTHTEVEEEHRGSFFRCAC